MLYLRDWEWIKGAGAELAGRVYVDIETRKVAAPPTWPLKTRWQPFMAGVAEAIGGDVVLRTVAGDSEVVLMNYLKDVLADAAEVVYSARSREFDRWVLGAVFTNARRALSPVPGDWPHLDEPSYRWRNVKPVEKAWRAADIPSAEVPDAWKRRDYPLVALHCVKDVASAMWDDPLAEWSGETMDVLYSLLRKAGGGE